MREYQFQYTKILDTLFAVLLTFSTFLAGEFLGLSLKLSFFPAIGLGCGLAVLVFRIIKKKIVRLCNARLSQTAVEFDLSDVTKVINFCDLVSFKDYDGKNGPMLYLNTHHEHFKLSANNNFCKTDDFKAFCEATMLHLDQYRNEHNPALIHKGSIFTTKGMLYFLVVATTVYLLAFIVESKALRLAIGIAGGLYLFIMWLGYVVENNKVRAGGAINSDSSSNRATSNMNQKRQR